MRIGHSIQVFSGMGYYLGLVTRDRNGYRATPAGHIHSVTLPTAKAAAEHVRLIAQGLVPTGVGANPPR